MVQGTYKVTNEVNNEEFEMKISIKTDTIWLSNNQYINNDSIFLYNFNNSFDSVTSRYASCITSESNNCINFNASYGIKDKFGNRWLLDNYDDPSTQEIENTWAYGKITFYFIMNNTAYWYDDGVPYQDLYIRQKGVKIY